MPNKARKARARSPVTRKAPPRSPIAAPVKILIETARRKQACRQHETLGINHWVTALRDLLPNLPRDLSWNEIHAFEKRSSMLEGNPGKELSPEALMAKASRLALKEGREAPDMEDVALVILGAAGLLPDHDPNLPVRVVATETAPVPVTPARISHATPLLQRFGRDLTSDARAGILPPVVGRHDQLALLTETLCRRTKRNIALVGAPGVGKRAIVEELARRVATGIVPAPLQGITIIEVQVTALLAGVGNTTELDERFGGILAEAAHPGIILFFDELRTIMPGGHDGLTLAISNELKPAISRGMVTCIVSGAEEDYLRFVEIDSTLRAWFAEWFQPIRVEELSAEKTLDALELVAHHMKALTGVTTPPSVQRWLVAFAAELLRNHKFPGKAVDLLEQSIAHAVANGRSRVTLSDAREVAERAIAIPADIESRLRRIAKMLEDSGLLLPADREALQARLAVTLRSLDLMPVRPNATILLAGDAAAGARALAETLADAIAGSPDRVIPIDFGLLTEPWDMRRLLGIAGAKGPPPEELPFEALIDAPWSVVLGENVDGCHPQVRASITRALSEGYFSDARGRKIYLSDAVVVLSAPSVVLSAPSPMGFNPHVASETRIGVASVFDRDLVEQADLVIDRLERDASLAGLTHHEKMLSDLVRRYRDRGLEITWDKTLVDWLRAPDQSSRSGKQWREWADQHLATALIPHLPARRIASPKRVTVRHEDDHLVVSQARKP